MRTTVGFTEWSLVLGAAVIVAVAIANVLMGGGPYFAMFAFGYCAVLGWMYWHHRATGIRLPRWGVAQGKSDAHRLLGSVDVLQGLSSTQIEQIAALGQWLRCPAGSALGRAGEKGDTLFVVSQGKVQLTAKSPLGEATIRVAGTGEALPLAAVVGSNTLITSMVAMTDLEVLAVPSASLRELCAQHPEIGLRLYESVAALLANRYRSTLAHLTEGMATGMTTALKSADFWVNL